MPAVLFQVWRFVAPGLYRKEKRFAMPLLVSSIVLFYAGTAFAYYVVFPLMFRFFAAANPPGVTMMTDISAYLDFVLTIFFAFGVAFEVPIATVMLVWTGLISLDSLRRTRPYVFLGTFVVGMFLTPPDVISQTLLAVPMYLLYESGIWMSRILLPDKAVESGA
jgi:sec-independent protein translocase protein TatC